MIIMAVSMIVIVIILLISLNTYAQYNISSLFAQPNSTEESISNMTFDEIIDGTFSPSAPDKFLESKGSFIPHAPFDPDRVDFMARFGPVEVISNNIKNNTKIIDFDEVPATTPPDFMRFMPPYQALFYVYNRVTQDITINSIRITEVNSNQFQSPFEFCGIDYANISIRLLPGETQTFSICFFPTTIGNSTAKLEFYQDSRLIFDIPLRGNGITPTGMMSEIESTKEIRNESTNDITNRTDTNTSNRTDRVQLEILNFTSDPTSSIIQPMTECSITIEGGGQRPNPEVEVNEIGPTNIEPLYPPDDGIETGDVAGHHKINVGELVQLEAKVSGIALDSIENIRWNITEPKIKDYDESVPGKFVIYNMTNEDYLKPELSFYWKDVGQKEVTVTVEQISNDNQSKKCSASRTFGVERSNDDINRQANDFYVFNHEAKVLERHSNWHRNNPQIVFCDPSDNGEDFFLYHKRVISNFDAWRETFGYPEIIAWDPATDPPTSKDLDNENREPIYRIEPIPSYFTIEGGETYSACSNLGYNQYSNITKLSDFISRDHLASEIEATWHGQVHGNIGGDMNNLFLAPKDPVFWMWHKYIDTVYDKYTEIKK